MKPVRTVIGRALPIDRDDIDTDQIIPAHWLRRTERTGYAAGLFEAWRRDPAFPLNEARYAGAVVLVAGANFGCGSSREHAAWAIAEYGFGAVVASSFADIFRANAAANGLVPVALPGAAITRIMRAVQDDPSTEIRVDVVNAAVDVPALELHMPFALDADTRTRLVDGLDDIDLTLRRENAITAYEANRPAWLPRLDRRAAPR